MGGTLRLAGTPDTYHDQAGRQSTIVVVEKLTTRKWTVEMNMMMLRDLLVEALYTLLYLGSQQFKKKGTYLIDTVNPKNVTLNLDFAESVTNLPKTQKAVFRDGKKIG